jgi:hypothetical protein
MAILRHLLAPFENGLPLLIAHIAIDQNFTNITNMENLEDTSAPCPADVSVTIGLAEHGQ